MFEALLSQYDAMQSLSEIAKVYNMLFEVFKLMPNKDKLLQDNRVAYEMRLYDMGVPIKRYCVIIDNNDLIVERYMSMKEMKAFYTELYREHFMGVELLLGRA